MDIGALTAEDEATDDDSLRALFEPFGNITSVVAMKETSLQHVHFGQCLMAGTPNRRVMANARQDQWQ